MIGVTKMGASEMKSDVTYELWTLEQQQQEELDDEELQKRRQQQFEEFVGDAMRRGGGRRPGHHRSGLYRLTLTFIAIVITLLFLGVVTNIVCGFQGNGTVQQSAILYLPSQCGEGQVKIHGKCRDAVFSDD